MNPILDNAFELASNNRNRIHKSKKHGCFYCMEISDGIDIVDWCDNGTTAICPHCGIDSILPDETNVDCLKEIHDVYFYVNDKIQKSVKPNNDTIEKLKILETEKNIYNIHYCRAGVGIQFYYPAKLDWSLDETSWKDGINCKQYYETFEECIDAEYDALGLEDEFQNTATAVTVDNYADQAYINAQISMTGDDMVMTGTIDLRPDVYEYYYESAVNLKEIGTRVNKMVLKGWDVDGDIILGEGDRYVQRMVRVIDKDNK